MAGRQTAAGAPEEAVAGPLVADTRVQAESLGEAVAGTPAAVEVHRRAEAGVLRAGATSPQRSRSHKQRGPGRGHDRDNAAQNHFSWHFDKVRPQNRE
jgi:hypothetical protein